MNSETVIIPDDECDAGHEPGTSSKQVLQLNRMNPIRLMLCLKWLRTRSGCVHLKLGVVPNILIFG